MAWRTAEGAWTDSPTRTTICTDSSHCEVSALAPNTAYTFTVTALNEAGESLASPALSVATSQAIGALPHAPKPPKPLDAPDCGSILLQVRCHPNIHCPTHPGHTCLGSTHTHLIVNPIIHTTTHPEALLQSLHLPNYPILFVLPSCRPDARVAAPMITSPSRSVLLPSVQSSSHPLRACLWAQWMMVGEWLQSSDHAVRSPVLLRQQSMAETWQS